MPDAKEISSLITAEQISASDLLETAIPNAMTETGYISRKHTLGVIADFFLKTLQFSNLITTAKTIIAAINEAAGKKVTDTLAAGSTSIVFTDNAIVASSLISVYSEAWYTALVIDGTNHTCTLTFPVQASAMDVTIVIK